MVDVLLFQHNNLESEEKRDECIENFRQTLNDAFKQFQKLWTDHKELLKKSKESGNRSPNDSHRLEENIPKTTDNSAAGPEERIISGEKSSSKSKEKDKEDCDPVSVRIWGDKKSSEPEYDQCFQIFSQDFSTQGLEENFINHSKTLLQEIQNVSPRGSTSPILGSKKRRNRFVPSPNLSGKSVVILDFDKDKGERLEQRSISNSPINSNIQSNIVANTTQSSSPAPGRNETCTPKNPRKWGISTIHNVNTDIIVGTRKKLKQSKLLFTNDEVTDLSTCEDVFVNKSIDRDQTSTDNRNCTRRNNKCLEDSVIQGSPEDEIVSSKTRRRIVEKNKNRGTQQQIHNVDENAARDAKHVENHGNTKNDVGITDTDLTIFDTKLCSTQYTNFTFDPKLCSTQYNNTLLAKTVGIRKSPVRDKPVSEPKTHPKDQGENDSNVIDETMFDGNFVSSNSRSQNKLLSEKSVKRKKLSLKKNFKSFKYPEVVSGQENNTTTLVHLPSSGQSKVASPPRKKKALANFDVVPRKRSASPTYVYKTGPVRNKAERALLNGWSCPECQNYYEGMGLTAEELQERKNKCSRHRSKFNEKIASQQGYWNPDFSSSYHSTIWCDD